MDTNEFTCAACGKTYAMARPDDEAMAESKLLWGDIAKEAMVVICDDCFNERTRAS